MELIFRTICGIDSAATNIGKEDERNIILKYEFSKCNSRSK